MQSKSPNPVVSPAAEHRSQSDRRKTPTSVWRAFLPNGRRLRSRRRHEHCRPYFVDRYSSAMFLGVVMLILATLIDAILTVQILRAGGEEVNPLMDRLLNHSLEAFVLGKYLLTVLGLPLLLIFKNHYLFGTRLRVGHLVPAAVALYGLLIAYQLVLMHQCGGW